MRSDGDGVVEAAGFVLAGGQSSRMGSDKALVEFGGRPLIAHAVGILNAAGLPVSIAGARAENRASLESYAPVISDAEPGRGPLGGICGALQSMVAQVGVFLPVDVPFMAPSLIAFMVGYALITGTLVTLASVNNSPQTFPAVLSRSTLPLLEVELRKGRLGCLAGFQSVAAELGQRIHSLPTEVLVQSGQISHPDARPVVHWFLNVNAAADLRMALSLRSSRVS